MKKREKNLISILLSLSLIIGLHINLMAMPVDNIDSSHDGMTLQQDIVTTNTNASQNYLSMSVNSSVSMLNYSGKQMTPIMGKDGKFYAVKGAKFYAGEDADSDDPIVLKIKKNGYVSVGRRWTSTLFSPIYGTIDITAFDPKISDKKLEMYVGDMTNIFLEDIPEGIPVSWESSNTNIVQVLSGNCYAVGMGRCTVNAYVGGKAFPCKIKVLKKPNTTILYNAPSTGKGIKITGLEGSKSLVYEDSSIKINKNKIKTKSPSKNAINLNFFGGYSFQIYANDTTPLQKEYTLKMGERVPVFSDNMHELISWKSKDPSIAYISEFGILTGQAPGKTKISAKVGGKKQTIKVVVTDEKVPDTISTGNIRTIQIIDPINGHDGYSVDIADNGNYSIIRDKDRVNTISENKPKPDDPDNPDDPNNPDEPDPGEPDYPDYPDPETPEEPEEPDDPTTPVNYDIPSGNKVLTNIQTDAGLYKNGTLVKSWHQLKQENIIHITDHYIVNCNGDLLDGGLVMDTEVYHIGRNAFNNCTKLTDIILPGYDDPRCANGMKIGANLQSIGDYAFKKTKLRVVNIPDSVKEIGEYAFTESNISSIIIPKDVTDIKQGTFLECLNLSHVEFGKGNSSKKLKSISSDAFLYTALHSITVPEGVTTIGDGAFSWCYVLSDVNLPNSLRTIERQGFYGDSSLEELVVPDNVTIIGRDAFKLVKTVYYGGSAVPHNDNPNWGAESLVNASTLIHNVYFMPNGPKVILNPKPIKKGNKLGELPVPDYPEYEFLGWFTEANGGEPVTENTVMGEDDITVYAHWQLI